MSKCDSCIYRASNDKAWKCEYISLVGHSRGCEPGDQCTEYIKGDKLPLSKAIQYNSSTSFKFDKYL